MIKFQTYAAYVSVFVYWKIEKMCSHCGLFDWLLNSIATLLGAILYVALTASVDGGSGGNPDMNYSFFLYSAAALFYAAGVVLGKNVDAYQGSDSGQTEI